MANSRTALLVGGMVFAFLALLFLSMDSDGGSMDVARSKRSLRNQGARLLESKRVGMVAGDGRSRASKDSATIVIPAEVGPGGVRANIRDRVVTNPKEDMWDKNDDDGDDDDDGNAVDATDNTADDDDDEVEEVLSIVTTKPAMRSLEAWATKTRQMDACAAGSGYWRDREDLASIRLSPRPILVRSKGCPEMTKVDAGVCILDPKTSKFGCLPSLVIIGTMKGGTAEVQGWLSMHPTMARWGGQKMSGAGEAHFFDKEKDVAGNWLDKYVYKGLTLPSPDDARTRYTFEKTPYYIEMEEKQIKSMHKLLPSTKLVTILRNPVSRAYSHFQHKCRAGGILRVSDSAPDKALRGSVHCVNRNTPKGKRIKKLEHYLHKKGYKHASSKHISIQPFPCQPADFRALLEWDWQKGRKRALDDDMMGGILKRGRYRSQIDTWLKYYKKDQLLVILTEDMFTKPIETIDTVQRFLGIPHFDYNPITKKNERGFTVLTDIDSKSNKKPYPALTDDVKDLLESYYRDHNTQLADFLSHQQIRKAWGPNATNY